MLAALYSIKYIDFKEGNMDVATAQAQLGNAAKSFLAGKHQLLMDGKSVEAKSGKIPRKPIPIASREQ